MRTSWTVDRSAFLTLPSHLLLRPALLHDLVQHRKTPNLSRAQMPAIWKRPSSLTVVTDQGFQAQRPWALCLAGPRSGRTLTGSLGLRDGSATSGPALF